MGGDFVQWEKLLRDPARLAEIERESSEREGEKSRRGWPR